MKISNIHTLAIAALLALSSCGTSRQVANDGASIAGGLKETKKQTIAAKRWKTFSIPEIKFEDKAPKSNGSQIYHALITNPDAYINKVAREVLNTLYYSEKASIPAIHQLLYTLVDTAGI